MEVQIELPEWMKEWVRPEAILGGAIAILLLVLAVFWFGWRWSIAEDRFEMMEQQAAEGFLQAPSTTRTVRINPREKRTVGVGGADAPQRIDLLIAAPSNNYERFRVSLLRADGVLVLHADRLVRDSNNDLRLSFNTSVLPAGHYRIRIEGYSNRGELSRYAEASMQVAGR